MKKMNEKINSIKIMMSERSGSFLLITIYIRCIMLPSPEQIWLIIFLPFIFFILVNVFWKSISERRAHALYTCVTFGYIVCTYFDFKFLVMRIHFAEVECLCARVYFPFYGFIRNIELIYMWVSFDRGSEKANESSLSWANSNQASKVLRQYTDGERAIERETMAHTNWTNWRQHA